VLDVATRKVLRVLPAGSDPETFDLGPARRPSSCQTRTWGSFHRRGRHWPGKDTVPVGEEPEGVTIHPDGASAWITGEPITT
jgi:hypothetical protein